MDQSEFQSCYYEWLTGKVFKFTNERNNYSYLLHTLHEIEYTYIVDKDVNRYNDGLELKKTFCREVGIDISCADLLGAQCSVLEMMVALSIRCEVSIMSDPIEGDRTWLWFMHMLWSMHLDISTNQNFDKEYVEKQIGIMLYRRYDEHGDGALFRVANPIYDMREAEVWSQLNWFLSERY